MSDRCKMCTYLMGTSRNQMYFQKCYILIPGYRFIFRLNWNIIFMFLFFYNRNLIRLFIFLQITTNVFLLSYLTLYDTQIIFLQCTFFEQLTQCLQSCQTFSSRNDSACISIQTVTYGWPECM